MTMTDPLADMLNRIMNAVRNESRSVNFPSSKAKINVCDVLKREGFIESFEIVEKPIQNDVKVNLKYGPNGERVINVLKRVSKPGCRVYKPISDIKPVLRGLGIEIVSTSKGVFSDRECRDKGVGGEILCTVW